MLSRIARKAGVVPYTLFMRARATELGFALANRAARALFRAYPSTLSPLGTSLIATLKRDGIATTSVGALCGAGALAELQKHAAVLEARAEVNRKKSFLLSLFDEEPLLEPEREPFAARALSPEVVDIANAYLGLFSRFYFFSLNITTPVGVGASAVASQRWHRDPEDRALLKMFIYLNEVDQESGPFTYIKGSQRGGKYGALFPQRPPRSSYPDEQALMKVVRAEDVMECTGAAGTVVFADTAGLHRGGFAKSKKRVMFTAGFYPGSSVWPELVRRPPGFEHTSWFENAPRAVRFAVAPSAPHLGKRLFAQFRNVYR